LFVIRKIVYFHVIKFKDQSEDNMTDTLEQLKTYNIATIHDKTQISVESISELLAHDFSKFKKTRFLGFVSIVEREFHVDLGDYKEEYLSCCRADEPIFAQAS